MSQMRPPLGWARWWQGEDPWAPYSEHLCFYLFKYLCGIYRMLDSKHHANNWTFSSKQPVRGELLIIPFHPREVTGRQSRD